MVSYRPVREWGVFRYFAMRKDPVTGIAVADTGWVIDMVRACGLVAVVVTVCISHPGPATASARGTAIAVVLGLSSAGWIAWMAAGRRRWQAIASLAVMGLAGGVLTGLVPDGAGIAVGCVVTFSAGAQLRLEVSLAIVVKVVAAFLITGLIAGASTGTLLGYPFAFIGLWTMGMTRHEYLLRAEQAERMLAETQRARIAETQAAALAERARIARDIHDVLAHSLAAVSVNLQAAEGLLASDSLPAGNTELAKAIECIDRAGTLTREGLAAARRAVLALREDERASLPDQLSALAAESRAAGDMTVAVSVAGPGRTLPEPASLAVFRTAQEALTNARKHAPGQPVALRLGFEPASITLSVVNPLPPDGTPSPLSSTGAGYGLTGLRERAALAGGSLEAGPADGNWRIALRIPT